MTELTEDEKFILLDGERAKRLQNNEDYRWAKEKLEKIIEAMSLISTLPKGTPEERSIEIDARVKAIGLVRTWFEEVEGTGVQQDFNKPKQPINSELITHFEE